MAKEKQKLVENFIVRSAVREIRRVQESNRVVEFEGKNYQCIAAFTFPISRPGKKNLNNRVYGAALWDKMIREKQGERKFGVCDHPDDKGEQPDGSVLKTFCVWRNMRYSENKQLILMDCYVFGANGKHFVDAIRAGGMPGFSTVGYGDFLDDGETIDPETYELDRPADWVMNPSYEVFGSIEDEIQLPSEDEVGGGQRIERQEEAAGIVKDIAHRARLTEDTMSLTLTEKSYKLQLKGLRKEAEAQPTLVEKLASYKAILPYVEDALWADERKIVEEAIQASETQIRELAAKGEKLGEVETTLAEMQVGIKASTDEIAKIKAENEALQKKLSRALTLADGLKVYANKLKEMHGMAKVELLTRYTAAEFKEMEAYAEGLKAKLEALQKGPKAPAKRESTFIGGSGGNARPVAQRRREADGEIDPFQGIEDAPEGEPEDEVDEAEHQLPDYSAEHGIHGDLQVDTRPEVIDEPEEAEPVPAVADYYEDLLAKNPKIEGLKKDILACKTIVEAQRTYARLKSLMDEKDFYNDGHRITRRVIKAHRSVSESLRDVDTGDAPFIRKGWF